VDYTVWSHEDEKEGSSTYNSGSGNPKGTFERAICRWKSNIKMKLLKVGYKECAVSILASRNFTVGQHQNKIFRSSTNLPPK
jgi:hypothetical protein